LRTHWKYWFLFGCTLVFDAQAQALTLEEALTIGEAQSPRMAAQRYALTAAEEQTGRAGQLPDPKLRVGIENIPVSGPDAWRYDRDSMTMRAIGLMQEFPSSDKRSARSARAARARDVERSILQSQRATLHRDIAVAWLEAHFAERSRTELERLVERLAAQSDTVAAGVARGRQSAAEGLMRRAAVEQARDKVLDQQRMMDRARYMLGALIGEEAHRPLGAPPDLARLVHPRDTLVEGLRQHPELRVLDQRQDLARAEVELARASRQSDWSVEVGYGHRAPAFDNMLTVMLAIDLPWQTKNRQDRDLASRLAELEQVRAQKEDARRMHEAEVRGWLADYDAATRRLQRYGATLLPLANERSAAALAAYRGGRGELSVVLEAQRAITETELAALAIEAERAKAWANLSYLYPHEGTR
jgi:outer membrane protein, heavy metal efflux system